MNSDAEHYQANKDSGAEWGDEAPAPRRRSERRRLDAMVSVRFSPEEADRVRGAAEAAGLSLSSYIRDLVLGSAHEHVASGRGHLARLARTSTTCSASVPASVSVGSRAREPHVTITSPIRAGSHTAGRAA